MEYRILGPLEVLHEGRPIALAARERAVLVRLLVDAGRVVSIDRLVDDLWGVEPPGSANVSVRGHVSRIRKALEAAGAPRVIETDHPGYRADVDRGSIDVSSFEELLAQGRAELARGDAQAASATLGDALALWRGPALADVVDTEFARAEAARLEEARLSAIEDKIEADLALGRHNSLVGELEALTSAHPLREQLWSQRMIALYRAGRQADALAAYQKLRSTLVDELGIDPSPDVARLEQQILAQDPVLASPVATSFHAPSDLPTGVVTFLFTDIEGSTRLWDEHPDAMPELLVRHDQIIKDLVTAAGGTFLQSKGEGDSTVSVFRRASQAASAALNVQGAVNSESWPDAIDLRVRIAVHTGEAHERDGNYFGPALNRSARLRSLSAGGQILVSQATTELIHDYLPKESRLADLGSQTLVGLKRAEHVYELIPPGATSRGLTSVAGPTSTPAEETFFPPLPKTFDLGEGRVFVGRGAELERLETLWKDAEGGNHRTVLLAGEPGIGKTRLVAEFGQRRYEHGAIVLYGRCDEDPSIPYQPFFEALRHYVSSCPIGVLQNHVENFGGDIARIVPDLTRRLPDAPPPTDTEAEVERFLSFEAVTQFLAAAAQGAPIVLALDDLQWAGKPTLLLLRHILRSEQLMRLLILGAYRETDLDRKHPLAEMLGDLRRDGAVERISLDGLDREEVFAYLEAAAGRNIEEVGAREFADALHHETDGNPFFIREVLRHLTETGVAYQEKGRWTADAIDPESGLLPEGVREAIARRLSRLSEEANLTLAVAAIAGATFAVEVLEGVPDVGEEALDALEEAQRAGLIVEGDAPGEYGFAHALIRQTLASEVTSIRRMRLHAAIGLAMERSYARSIDAHLPELAHHFFEAAHAGDPTKAVGYSRRAGEQARQRAAYEEAVEHYRRALESLSLTEAADEERADLLLSLAESEMRKGDTEAGKAVYRDVAEIARRIHSPELLGRAAIGGAVGGFGIVPFPPDEVVVGQIEEALDALGNEDSAVRVRLLARLAAELGLPEHARRLNDVTLEAVQAADRLRDPETQLVALEAREAALLAPDGAEQRLIDADRVLALALEVDDKDHLMRGRQMRLRALVELNDLPAADAEFEQMERLAASLRQPAYTFTVLGYRGIRAILDGRWTDAEGIIEEMDRIGAETVGPVGVVMTSALKASIRSMQGRLDESAPSYEAIAEVSPVPSVTAGVAWGLAEQGLLDDARRIFELLAVNDFADFPRDGFWTMGMETLGLIAATLGDIERGQILYDLLAPYERTAPVLMAGGLMFAFGPMGFFVGVLATALGRWEDAERNFRNALDLEEAWKARAFYVRTHTEYARMLLSRDRPGDRENSRDHLSHAIATADELEMGVWSARARELKRQLDERG